MTAPEAPAVPLEKRFVMSVDEYGLVTVVAALLTLRAVMHSEPEKVAPALHCNEARDAVGTAEGLLRISKMLDRDEPANSHYEEAIRALATPALEWLVQRRPEWMLAVAQVDQPFVIVPKKGVVN